MVKLPDGEKNCEDMCNRLDRITACDRQTDEQTSCHNIALCIRVARQKLNISDLHTSVLHVLSLDLHVHKIVKLNID